MKRGKHQTPADAQRRKRFRKESPEVGQVFGDKRRKHGIEGAPPSWEVAIQVRLDQRGPRGFLPSHAQHAAREIEPDGAAPRTIDGGKMRTGPTPRVEHPLSDARI